MPTAPFLRNHFYLTMAIIAGIVAALLLARHSTISRMLVGWNVTIWFYLVPMGWRMSHASHAKVRKIAEQEDESAVAVLTIMSLAAVASLAALVVELSTAKGQPVNSQLMHYVLTASTVLSSWCMLGTLFTFHYARAFYQSPTAHRALLFPDKEQNPDYWDFLYFSFTIAVAAQTSDVLIMNRSTRKAVLAQSVLSFLFNAAILGLSINIAAGLIGS